METLYDWWAVMIFGALSLTWLSRSVNKPPFPDPPFTYGLCAIGCATGNWLGNQSHSLPAVVVLLGTMALYAFVIRPLRRDQA